jgi:hypothetical protein
MITDTQITETLERYKAGTITWREACLALQLWSYDELNQLLEAGEFTLPMPQSPATETFLQALLETVPPSET